jgi:DNA-binding NarL/FixJ family response regulator
MTSLEEAQTSVLIADDHALIRVGIQTLISQLQGYQVVGEAADGRQALECCLALQPDIVLMDVSMPGMNGIEVAQALQTQGFCGHFIMLSGDERPDTVQAALKVGSRGYLLKNLLLAELEIALDAVRSGKSYISPGVADLLIELARIESAAPARLAERTPIDVLTERQRVVLAAIVQGRSNKEIARELAVSPKTVEFHRAEIMQRLDVHDLATLVRIAIKAGLVEDR